MSEHANKKDTSAEEKDAEPVSMKAALDDVHDSFHWYASAVGTRLQVLDADLRAVDPPTWNQIVADGLLKVVLEMGTNALGAYLATSTGHGLVKGAEHAHAQETAKELYKAGIKEGYEAGHKVHHASHGGDAIAHFLGGHKGAVDAQAAAAQSVWNATGRYKVKSSDEANALRSATRRASIDKAADAHYDRCRDAWLNLLAQSKFGAVNRADGTVTTNMSDLGQRTMENLKKPGSVPWSSPTANDALHDKSPGVLTVMATLPGFDSDKRPIGVPTAKLAILGGVNKGIRDQYQHASLANAHVPRQVHAEVGSVAALEGYGDFTVNVDETGRAGSVTNGEWLRANAERTHPSGQASPMQKAQIGLGELLKDLVVGEIKGPMPGAWSS